MTRKKAIEAAIDAINGKRYVAIPAALGMAYDAGRIAGLREAARLISTRCTGCDVEITQHARALAKKASKP